MNKNNLKIKNRTTLHAEHADISCQTKNKKTQNHATEEDIMHSLP